MGVSGFPVEIGSCCSVLTLPDAVDVRAEMDGDGVATIPYANLTKIDISGETSTTDAGMIGGGFGLQGAAEGMAVASIINALSRKTSIHTWLWIASPYGDLRLHHGSLLPSQLSRWLEPLFRRYQMAQHIATAAPASNDDPISQLERLAALRDKGLLSEEEFHAARARQIRRLTEDA